MLTVNYVEFVQAITFLAKATPRSQAMIHADFDGRHLLLRRKDDSTRVTAGGTWPEKVKFYSSGVNMGSWLQNLSSMGGNFVFELTEVGGENGGAKIDHRAAG